jgi:hypothetical protein
VRGNADGLDGDPARWAGEGCEWAEPVLHGDHLTR